MKTGITLITMGAGNVLVLRKTLESFKGICDEVIYGDLLLWESDREIVKGYAEEFNMRIVQFPFDYIFRRGFSDLLNMLAAFASNDMVLYMNTSEVVQEDYGVVDVVKNNPDCNAFFFIHKTDPHRWHRLYNKKEMRWSGRIHEQLKGEYKPYHHPVFCMADLPKDMGGTTKSKVLDSLKEIVYFQQYIEIVDKPEELGETDPGWLAFAKADYESFKERLQKKGRLYEAIRSERYEEFMKVISENDWDKETYVSSIAVEFQNDKKYLL